MSAPGKQSGGSRWGSFLQQAVAGIEQNLDNILSGEDVPQSKLETPAPTSKEAVPSRNTTSNPSSTRLQDRLAKAVAAKAAAQRNGAQSPSSVPSRVGTPSIAGTSPRPSLDSIVAEKKTKTSASTTTPEVKATGDDEDLPGLHEEYVDKNDDKANAEAPQSKETAVLSAALETARPSTESVTAAPRLSTASRPSIQVGDSLSRPSVESGSREQQILAAADRDEEIQTYIERIDSLQAKLLYLAKESAEGAKKAAADAPAGSMEMKLAEKDEQIALLMEEGQKLSKAELKHMTVIKRLRAKTGEAEKESKLSKDRLERLENENASLKERLSRAEAAERQTNEKQKRITQLEKEKENLRKDNGTKDILIASLKSQVAEATSEATADELKKLHIQLDAEKRRANDLEEEASSIKIKKDLAEDKAKSQLNELQAKMERETERAKASEVELNGEIQMLESRLEVMRARAEEVSSGATGDAQAKLLRQIETLQTQYAVASENWQGIEASLDARLTKLQTERDEALKRESDIRKKARDQTLKAKANEDKTETLQNKISDLTQELSVQKTKLDWLQKRAEESETALKEAEEAFVQEKQTFAAEMKQRAEEESSKWREEQPRSPFGNFDRAVSEVASSRRGLTAEYLGLQNIQTSRRPSRVNVDDFVNGDRRISRTGSAVFQKSAGHATLKRQDSTTLFSPTEGHNAPSIMMDQEDYFENVQSPLEQHYTGANDVISTSTAGAGPSVQLVERMSAAVRRLENEKVTMKEELARLASQRDEARSEMKNLMEELEAKRSDHDKVIELENEIESINQRYQTTLEMLGEKSETVEELKADIVDLKTMYRNLAEEYSSLKK